MPATTDETLARQEMLLNFQGLVRSLAWKMYQKLPASVELEDLVAYGQLGLMEAANHFDPGRGFQFTTFAYYRIRGAILDGLSQLSWFDEADFHGSRYRSGHADSMEAKEDADLYALADRQAAGRMVSLPEGGINLEDKRAVLPERQVDAQELCRRVRAAVLNMPGDEGKLLRAAYFDDMPLSDAAQQLGISRSWASRLHERALRQLGQSIGVKREG